MNQFNHYFILFVTLVSVICLLFRCYTGKGNFEFFKQDEEWKKHTIPHKVWQTYATTQLPEQARKCQLTWFDQSGFKYNFMNDHQIDYFIKKHFDSKVYKAFKDLPLGVMKADFWRYCVLYKYGGVYSDIDSVLVKSFSEWGIKNENKLIIGLENDVHFCQWTIACVPKHPILWNVIENITTAISEGININDEHFVHKYTGPGIWTKTIKKTLDMEFKSVLEIYELYKNSSDKSAFEKWGLRIENRDFFSKEYVRNLFGSTQFSSEYKSWIQQRDKLLQEKQNLTTGGFYTNFPSDNKSNNVVFP